MTRLFVGLLFVIGVSALTQEEIEDEITTDIRDHKVTMFSKTYCPYSRRLKTLLSTYRIDDLKIIELDLSRDMNEMQDFLNTLSGRRTVPQLFIDGQFIGGSDDTHEKERRGELRPLLENAGAIDRQDD